MTDDEVKAALHALTGEQLALVRWWICTTLKDRKTSSPQKE